MFLNRVFRQEWFNRFLWLLVSLVRTVELWGDVIYSLIGIKMLRYRHMFKTAFLQKMSIISKPYDKIFSSANKPQSSLVLYLRVWNQCTNSWSNLTLKCNINTFVKADAQIEENCRRTMNVLSARVFFPKTSVARNWVIRNLRQIQFRNTRRTILCWMRARLKNVHSSNLLSICLSLFETYRS